MPRSTREIIGEIINPRPRPRPGPQPPLSVQPVVPLASLIGWTIGPPGAPVDASAESAAPERAEGASDLEPMPLPPF